MVDDSELVRRFKDGDETGFDELVRRYQQRIRALLLRLVRNAEDANELAQDAFVRAFRALPGFREQSSFYTWLYRIAVNLAFNHLRKQRRNRVQTDDDRQLDEGAMLNLAGRDTPQSDFRRTRLQEAISSAVAQLPDGQRAVFIMRQYDDLSNDEIARVLGCSSGTVKAQHFYAVRKLREALEEWRE